MAFQQTPLSRQSGAYHDTQRQSSTANQTPTSIQALRPQSEQSQEWVLFPTRTRSSFTHTDLSDTVLSGDLSQISNLPSPLHNAAQQQKGSAITNSEAIEDDDLDVLDDSLHAFHDPMVYTDAQYLHRTTPILPTHDGLGAFHQSSRSIQEYLRRYENPASRNYRLGQSRRRSSVQRRLDLADLHDEQQQEKVRNERIEEWRVEHSRVLLDEIEKERRRRMSYSSHHTNRVNKRRIMDPASSRRVSAAVENRLVLQGTEESIWQKLTRRFMQSIMGADDELLAVIFGEALPNVEGSTPDIDANRQGSNHHTPFLTRRRWEKRLIERMSRELYLFDPHVHRLLQGTVPPIPEDAQEEAYAGLPVPVPSRKANATRDESKVHPRASPSDLPSMTFKPTLQTSTLESQHASSWGIEDDNPSLADEIARDDALKHEREYWESTPTFSTVFRYIRDRFVASRTQNQKSPVPVHPSSDHKSISTLRRASLIRQLHPLIAIQQSNRRGSSLPRPPSSILLHRQSSLLRRPMSLTASHTSSGAAYTNYLRSGSSCRSENNFGKRRAKGPRSSEGFGGDGVSAWGEV